MDIIETSLEIALNAYKGQKDKAGKTYILHPLRLMNKMKDDGQMAVALLHDVIEDSHITAADLLHAGIPQTVVDAVQCLTKQESESYEQFIQRIKANPLATAVKIADIEDNINILRLDAVTEKDLQRVNKYHKAWHELNSPNS